MREVVAGPKKAGQDAQAVVGSRTGELVVAYSAIQGASLEYCLDTLEKNKPKEPFKEMAKANQELHEMRMSDDDGELKMAMAMAMAPYDYKKYVKAKVRNAAFQWLLQDLKSGHSKVRDNVYSDLATRVSY